MNAQSLDLRSIAVALGGEVYGGNRVKAPGPNHSPQDRSLWVELDPAAPEGFKVGSFAEDPWRECRDHVRAKLGLPAWEPRRRPEDQPRAANANQSRKVAEYIYRAEDNSPHLKVERLEWQEGGQRRKSFPQYHWTGSVWAKGKPKGPKLPYRLPELLRDRESPILIAEGEKDADRLGTLGLLATTASEGAGKWTSDLAQWFAGRRAFILPDNDAPGRAHARKVAESLHAVAAEVRIVDLPDLPERGDVSDWIAAGGDAAGLLRLCEAAECWAPGLEPTDAPDAASSSGGWIMQSAAEFTADFVSPEYVVDGVIQRGYLYTFTAPTGSGKTAVMLYASAAIATGQDFAGREVEVGDVLFLAGENPDDVRARMIAIGEHYGIDLSRCRVHFIAGTFSIRTDLERLRQEAARLPNLILVVIDTFAAYFDGDDENNNAQALDFARVARGLTQFPSRPAVVMPAHPVKNATRQNLEPKGGSSLVNDVDGNLTLWKEDEVLTFHWHRKIRGADFEPLRFELVRHESDRLRDRKGRRIPTILARPLAETRAVALALQTLKDEDRLLLNIRDLPAQSIADRALELGLQMQDGRPYKSKVQRLLKLLVEQKLIRPFRGNWELTELGQKAVGIIDEGGSFAPREGL